MSLTWVSAICDWVSWTVEAFSYVSQSMASVERILEIANPGPNEVEKPQVQEIDNKLGDQSWPQNGEIKAQNLICRYRENTPRVLKGISFEISSNEKIGVVGRTGSGKSTLILMFKRILEVDKVSEQDSDQTAPSLFISGVDISQIGLKILRENIVLIPQDPFLLQGTIKFNLDPFEKLSDKAILDVLKKTRVYDSLVSTITRKADDPLDKLQTGQNADSEKEKLKNPAAGQQTQINPEDILNFPLESGGGNLSLG